MKRTIATMALGSLLVMAVSAHGALVVTKLTWGTGNLNELASRISAADSLDSNNPERVLETSTPLAPVLYDGVTGDSSGGNTANFTNDGSNVLTIDFDLSGQEGGWALTELAVYAGRDGHVSNGRQEWQLLVRRVGEPSFTELISSSLTGAGSDYTAVMVSGSEVGEKLARNLEAVQFVFRTGSNYNRFLHEIDMTLIPEPATISILVLAGIGLMRRQRV